jgi:hypothetical protein
LFQAVSVTSSTKYVKRDCYLNSIDYHLQQCKILDIPLSNKMPNNFSLGQES